MKLLTTVAAALLGSAFMTFGANFFLNFMPMPADPSATDAPHKLFMAALFPTGYLAFVKALEILGGLLVILPKTRNLGLLILGPIVVNIIAFHLFLTRGSGLTDPPLLVIYFLAAFLLITERKAWFNLLKCPPPTKRL